MLSANVLRSQDLFVECKSIIRMLSSFFHKPCNALPTISSNFNLIKKRASFPGVAKSLIWLSDQTARTNHTFLRY